MKKLFVILFACIFTSAFVSAQFFSFGVKGGVNYSQLKFDELSSIVSGSDADYYSLAQDESFQSFHFGVMGRLKIFNAYLQPELYFNTSGGKVLIQEFQTDGSTVDHISQVKYSKIDLPVLIGFKFGPARLNAGPVASVVLKEDNEIGEIIPELESMSKTATIGYQAGIGIDILKFLTLDYRYEGGLSKWGEKLTVAGTEYPFDSRANIHLISMGILF